jgi:hypothetical protein
MKTGERSVRESHVRVNAVCVLGCERLRKMVDISETFC